MPGRQLRLFAFYGGTGPFQCLLDTAEVWLDNVNNEGAMLSRK
ncbi:hypothetical protein HM1_1852 [Heliomicrobium modesticaldum Ice1]|uniref:Uncharacterized protein n=1 Tax=Heliobacterium modesticaldum (strain ATCC 51547 / Ice1) TaxID=498761 RepID=B0TF93_HELMI|nr:hypothetical protein HM1_1852 [Heliomicrobium modesticaldum Ice1]